MKRERDEKVATIFGAFPEKEYLTFSFKRTKLFPGFEAVV